MENFIFYKVYKITNTQKGKPKSEMCRQNMKKSKSEEHKQKLRESVKKYWENKKHPKIV